MTKSEAIQIVWDYMLMHQPLKKADAIVVLGNRDLRVAQYSAELYLQGWAPRLIFSGSGSIHNHKPGREQFRGTTEAEIFAEQARKMGVPPEAILIENRSQNTGENYQFTLQLLREMKIDPKSLVIVQKPYMERRAYATGKIWWPQVELIVSSPAIPLSEYAQHPADEYWVHTMVGDLQRIKEYPKQGFQIPQIIPDQVWGAYEFLISLGYTNRLIK